MSTTFYAVTLLLSIEIFVKKKKSFKERHCIHLGKLDSIGQQEEGSVCMVVSCVTVSGDAEMLIASVDDKEKCILPHYPVFIKRSNY